MAESVSIQPSSTDDDHPMSLVSSRSASTVSLVSSNVSSDSEYRSCVDEMDTEVSPSDETEFLSDEADPCESVSPIET